MWFYRDVSKHILLPTYSPLLSSNLFYSFEFSWIFFSRHTTQATRGSKTRVRQRKWQPMTSLDRVTEFTLFVLWIWPHCQVTIFVLRGVSFRELAAAAHWFIRSWNIGQLKTSWSRVKFGLRMELIGNVPAILSHEWGFKSYYRHSPTWAGTEW